MREEIERDVAAQAIIFAQGSAAAVEFRDPKAAIETLDALVLRPNAQVACLYDIKQQLFERYVRVPGTSCPTAPPPTGSHSWGALEMVQDGANARGELVGTLYIRRGMADVHQRLRIGLLVVLGLLPIAVAAAFHVSAGMQRSIASPLLQLAR